MHLTADKNHMNELINRCIDGDQMAYQQVYEMCAKGVFSSIIRIVRSKEEAEDLLQDTFATAFQQLKYYRGEASLFGWIKRIGVNKSLNQIKKKKLDIKDNTNEADLTWQEDPWNNIDLPTPDQIARKIQLLPDGFRVVLSLYLFEGYSHKEIASELAISESTSKTQYLRGKKKLKQLFEAHEA